MYNKNVSEKVRSLSKKLEAAKDEKEFFDAVTGFYKDYGVGMFGLNKAFRIDDTPQGVLHSVLKNYGYNVIDMGKDVPCEDIVDTAIRENAAIIGLSALMTTTMMRMQDVVELCKEKGCKSKVIIGGACITQSFADEIGADGYSKDAAECVRLVETKKLSLVLILKDCNIGDLNQSPNMYLVANPLMLLPSFALTSFTLIEYFICYSSLSFCSLFCSGMISSHQSCSICSHPPLSQLKRAHHSVLLVVEPISCVSMFPSYTIVTSKSGINNPSSASGCIPQRCI